MSKVYVVQKREISFCDYPIENEQPYGIFTDKVKAQEALLKVARTDMNETVCGSETSIFLDSEYFDQESYSAKDKKWIDDLMERMEIFPDTYEEVEKIDLSPILRCYAKDKFTIWEIELDKVQL